MSSFNDIEPPKLSPQSGAMHPINQVKDFLIDLLQGYGFTAVDGPEIESEFYNLSSNNKSGIIKIVFGGSSFLFTGDAEKRVENILINDYQSFLDVDVLKVGHHGSKTSSSTEFLQYTSPQNALISAGIKNKFGHPHENVISKFKSNNVKILRTDINCAVLIVSDGEQIFAENWK